jgi:hypothetical protein
MTDNLKRDVKRLERQYEALNRQVTACLELNQILLALIAEDRPHLKPVIEALKGQADERN